VPAVLAWRNLYNLYHLLNHHFGERYAAAVDAVLRRLAQ
jgi:fructosamine-3-kinase